MKIKQTLIIGLLLSASGASLLAREPFLLKNNGESDILKQNTSILSKKKAPKRLMANLDGESNIAIKINLTQIAIKNLSFQAEYGFHKKMSVALGFSYLMKRSLGALYDSGKNQYASNFTTPMLNGFALTPEFRFYPGGRSDKPAPRGFYIAAYLRYAKYNVTQTVSYQDNSSPGSPVYSADATQTYSGVNGGLMIGQQWIIAKHFTIDWWIIGAGYGKAKYSYSWMAPGANLNASQQAQVKQQAEDNFGTFSALGLNSSVSTTHNSATMNVTGLPMFSIRFMGLCIGYAF